MTIMINCMNTHQSFLSEQENQSINRIQHLGGARFLPWSPMFHADVCPLLLQMLLPSCCPPLVADVTPILLQMLPLCCYRCYPSIVTDVTPLLLQMLVFAMENAPGVDSPNKWKMVQDMQTGNPYGLPVAGERIAMATPFYGANKELNGLLPPTMSSCPCGGSCIYSV